MAEEVIKIEQLSHFKDKLLEKCDETYQGKLTAGENITISEDNVISATGGSGTSDLVFFDYESGNPEVTWDEIKSYMDIGRQVIIYDKTVTTDGKTKFGYVSNYDKANNFIQFTNVSNFSISGTNYTGVNWAYLGNNLGWQRTLSQSGGGSGGKTYEGVAPVVVDNTNDQISVNNKELFVQRPLNIAYDENENPVIQADTIKVDYQQITHDDSLVHVSNNAQYALGVNIPAIKQFIFDSNSFVYEKTQLNSGTLSSGNTYELDRTFTKEGYYPISFDFYANDRQFLMYPRNVTKTIGSLYVNGSCTNKYSSSLACTWGIFITWMKV